MCCYKKKPIKVIWKNIILGYQINLPVENKKAWLERKSNERNVFLPFRREWGWEMQKIFCFWPPWKRLVNPQYFLKHVYKLLETFVILVMIKLLKFIGFPFCTLIKLLKFIGFTCLVFSLALKEHSCFVNFDHWHVYHENRKKKRKKCIS